MKENNSLDTINETLVKILKALLQHTEAIKQLGQIILKVND